MSKLKDLSLKTPNDEQKLAIEHNGGVLLSAGAGSGKTFVLVEHIVHLFSQFCNTNSSSLPVEEFSLKLKDYFSEIVMMTFTKKAAGELSLRLQERFQVALARAQEIEDEPISAKLWEVANEQIDNIFVGTIHSFCYRLIGQGLIPGFSGSEDMISEPELRNKLNELFDGWLDRNIKHLKDEELQHVLINKVFFRNHFLKVFSDTDLRVLWSEYQKNEDQDLVREFEELLPLFCEVEWKSFLFDSEQFRPDDKKIPVWFSFLEHFSEKTSQSKDFLSFCSSANDVFLATKRMPSAPRKQGFDEVKKLIGSLKLLRDFLKSYFPDLTAAISNKEVYQKNGDLYLRIYKSLESNYFNSQGLTFTDLEFFVWKALANNKEACDEIRRNYSYFIIDEFQDTSSVQFSIVRSVIDSDMNKVFCVGDIKQAIYGFRGGELGVFKKTSQAIYKSFSLRNNYRSSEKVIQLNNHLFEYLLPLGENYVGEDEFSVPMLKQVVPDFKQDTGSIEKVSIDISGELEDGSKSLKPTALNLIESIEIANKVSSEKEKNFCILYRKLTPTRFLIPALIERGVGFTCQVKVQLDQDPILALFCEYCRLLSFKEVAEEVELSSFVISNILFFLDCPLSKDKTRKLLNNAVTGSHSFGLLESFKQFLWSIGLSSTNLDHPWPLVEVLCHLSFNQPEKAYEKVSSYNDGNYSIDFRSGENSSRIVIMTAHSSKGLEFDHVILGGIHTNGVDKNDGDLLGKFPDSYKWFLGRRKTDVYRSPSYIKEQEIKRRKSFSESKRLFYVAATRAVDSLVWIDITYNEKPASFSKNSWINALRLWEQDIGSVDISLSECIKNNHQRIERSIEDYGLEDSRLDLISPIYQKNSLGTEWTEEEAPKLGSSAELSVTRLATLEQCPRKFHLKNVLKLEGEDFLDENLMVKNEDDEVAEAVVASKSVSSASRGTRVHEVLETIMTRNFVMPRVVDLDDQAIQGVSWVSGLLKDQYFSGNYNFISEVQIKFSIFGQMISGTPDLVVKPLDPKENVEVWDYKTGRYSEEKCDPYWLQLYCYGLSQVGSSEEVRLVLAFVDDQKVVEKTLNLKDLKSLLFTSWQKLSMPDEINQNHCQFCEYRGLCFPSS